MNHHVETLGVQLALFEVDYPALPPTSLRSVENDGQPDAVTECDGQLELSDPYLFLTPRRAA
jgi:hypothetical protein